ncbi:hypothetical protein COLO4_05603 [Corchorus olitorius]|uniref:Uncharacterized protein n=1 Tax=Corchorus olitorius TaxID=93759 RepID=A0A1R3KQI3_9ROSI|nr:hypothetical protein COLO4_05603 [Corchorus olitorius]
MELSACVAQSSCNDNFVASYLKMFGIDIDV